MSRWAIGLVCVALTSPVCAQFGVRETLQSGTSVRSGEIKKDPQEELRRQRETCRRRIDATRKKIAAGKWGEARKTADRARLSAVDMAQLDQVRRLYVELDKEAHRQLAEAERVYADGKYVEAIKAFGLIGRIFGGLPAGMAARRAADFAKQDPEAQAAVQELKAAMMDKRVAKILLGRKKSTSQPTTRPTTQPTRVEQIKKLPTPRQMRVVDLLTKMSKTFGASPSGKRAGADLKALLADKAFAAKLARRRRSEQARNALKMAETYDNAGLTAKAAEFYKQLVRNFPDTHEAAKAKAALSLIEEGLH